MSSAIAADNSQRSEPQFEESFCLKWNDYQNHLSGVVRQLLEEECMVDVTLAAAGERIHAHRIVLSACSTLFQEILSQVNEDHPTIILSDISAQDARSIVEFSYHGEVRIPVENIGDLLEAAHSLKICGLMEIDGLDENDAIISTKDQHEEERAESTSESNEPGERTSDAENDTAEQGECKKKIVTRDIASITDKRRKRRRDALKKEYSAEMLVSAINDLKSGQTLVEAATRHNIPRSTLYMRAKAMGIELSASRNEYPAECMRAAIDAVVMGSSLQHASEKYYIPKTVLWRRIQKEGYQTLRSEFKRSYGSDKREAAVRALQRGENLTKVALEFQIPKTTLFRDKARLVDEGKLPESFWKKRKTGDEEIKRIRLEEAVAACKGGRMSQAAASMAYRIPKTTIWRRLQQDGKTAEHNVAPVAAAAKGSRRSNESQGASSHRKIQRRSPEFTLCQLATEIPTVTYINDDTLPEDSVIILTTENVQDFQLDEDRRTIASRSPTEGVELDACALTVTNDTDAGIREEEEEEEEDEDEEDEDDDDDDDDDDDHGIYQPGN